MKQYDHIYVPTQEVVDFGFSVFRAPNFEATDYLGEVEEECSVIVLSVEELRELWDVAREKHLKVGMATDFETYIQSKGITI